MLIYRRMQLEVLLWSGNSEQASTSESNSGIEMSVAWVGRKSCRTRVTASLSSIPDPPLPSLEYLPRPGAEWVTTVQHGDEEIEQFRGRSMLARTGYRAGVIEKALAAAGYDAKQFAAVGGRGGFLPPMACGTYLVDDAIIEELRAGAAGRARQQSGRRAGASLCAGCRGECLHCRSRDGG